MIEKIVLKNFESHKDTTINFDNGVFILSGSSNAGKSSILRAFRFVALNQPASDKMINFDADECSVFLYVNGHVIERTRARNNKKNLYKVDGLELKAFGQNVPQEVMDAIGMGEINFEWQWDARPFLLCETGGAISQKINDVMNLNLIDTSQKNAESKRRMVKKTIETDIITGKKLSEEIESLEFIHDVSDEYDKVEALDKDLSQCKKKVESLSGIKEEIERINDSESSIKVVDGIDISNVCGEYEENQKDIELKEKIDVIYQEIIQNEAQKERLFVKNFEEIDKIMRASEGLSECSNQFMEAVALRKLYETEKNCEVPVVSKKDMEELDSAFDIITKINPELEEMRLTLSEYYDILDNVKRIDEEMNILKKEYSEIVPDICPLCGHKMDKELK